MRLLKYTLLLLALSLGAFAQELQPKDYSWEEPEFRMNGEELRPDEIGGYELRYKETGTENYTVFVLERGDAPITGHTLMLPPGNFVVEIAAYDVNGLYSDFISLQETVNPIITPPNAPGNFRNTTPIIDIIDPAQQCSEVRVECTLIRP